MKINNFFKGKQLRFANMFFTSEEEDVMNVCVFKNIPVRGDSYDDMLEKCIRLIEDGFDSYEWMVKFNRKMSAYMGGVHYQDLSSCYFDGLKKSSHGESATYKFDLLVTDMPTEYSRVEIITGLSVLADSYNDAITKVRAWVERNYSHFKELEWHIKDQGKIQIFCLEFKILFND